MKQTAKKWLLDEFKNVTVKENYKYQISIPPEVIKEITKYQKELKAFLTLTVIVPEVKKVLLLLLLLLL